jgi:hypothetical protein
VHPPPTGHVLACPTDHAAGSTDARRKYGRLALDVRGGHVCAREATKISFAGTWIGPSLRVTRWKVRLSPVVLFFEFLLVAAVVVITWFALYTLYRLVTDES